MKKKRHCKQSIAAQFAQDLRVLKIVRDVLKNKDLTKEEDRLIADSQIAYRLHVAGFIDITKPKTK